jgi:hypothetical protein
MDGSKFRLKKQRKYSDLGKIMGYHTGDMAVGLEKKLSGA